jgi:hypothetical protein
MKLLRQMWQRVEDKQIKTGSHHFRSGGPSFFSEEHLSWNLKVFKTIRAYITHDPGNSQKSQVAIGFIGI